MAVNSRTGDAKIKPQYLFQAEENGKQVEEVTEPLEKKLKVEEDDDVKGETNGDQHKSKKDKKGQNKHRPRTARFNREEKLCYFYFDGVRDDSEKCPNENCPFLHDVKKYLETKKDGLDEECPNFLTYGKCHRGVVCLFAASHIDPQTHRNLVNTELWAKMKPEYESCHKTLLDKTVQQQLRKKKYDFKSVEDLVEKMAIKPKRNEVGKEAAANTPPETNDGAVKTCGAVTDEDMIPLKFDEIKKIDWNDKLYLSPLTTVGNLPFRRLCVDFGADITCSEMSLATSILQGNNHEFALHRRHPCEKIWGVQLCANNPWAAAKAAKVLTDVGVECDFVDLNVGCPLENICRNGSGAGLMLRTHQYQSVVKSMSAVMCTLGKPFTVKMRTGVKIDKNFAHTLIPYCRDVGVGMVTLHGRTRDQRYLKQADWNYISECAKIASPMPLFGNGDILNYEDYEEKKVLSNVTGAMIGRGALMKPWVFQEIKERRHIDKTSGERLDLIKQYCHYGLDHWGSDSQGVETTRRFLLEWLSFYYRYIPVGILEDPPQRINERPPRYKGRDEIETLLGSPNSNDWVKISEMFLGPVPDNFVFLPKHKASSWAQ